MKITKFPQSCLKIEDSGQAIMVDIGMLATAEYKVEDFGEFDSVIFTHRHPDHLDVEVLPKLGEMGVAMYSNADVAQLLRESGCKNVEEVDPGEELVISGFKVKTYDMPHCLMVDGSKGVPNMGFLLNDHLLLPGDSVEPGEVTAVVIALPIFGPDISFKDAFALAGQVQAKYAIPVHYDVVQMNPNSYQKFKDRHGGPDLHILKNGQSVDL